MKKFVITGPETSKTFSIEDDEMIEWNIIKIEDYENREAIIKWTINAEPVALT